MKSEQEIRSALETLDQLPRKFTGEQLDEIHEILAVCSNLLEWVLEGSGTFEQFLNLARRAASQ